MQLVDGDCTRVIEVLKAIAHPVRLRIVANLCAGEAHVNALAAQLDVSQAIVSQQLRILRMSGLVEVTRQNGYAIYSIANAHLKDLLDCIETGCDAS